MSIFGKRVVCHHIKTRCIHGDEINARTKVFLRWWKDDIVYRQLCLLCGAPLPIPPICSVFPGQHQIYKWEEKRARANCKGE
jgi:hypothetical protein